MNTKIVVAASISFVVGAAAGAFGAVTLQRKAFQQKYSAIAEEEIDAAKIHYEEHYKLLYKGDEYATVAGAAEQLVKQEVVADVLEQYRTGALHKSDERAKPVDYTKFSDQIEKKKPQNVWEQPRVENPGPEQPALDVHHMPYIISQSDYEDNDGTGYDQATLTFYAGDGKLVDERDELIEDIDLAIGEHNLTQFGSEVDTVYIRNQKLLQEFEVVRSMGSYAVEVLGLEVGGG